MSDLYILFERSNSLVGKLGRIFIPYPYTHVTISFDGETYHSFSRRHFHDPFDAGLTDEKLAYFAYEEVQVKIYRMSITEEEKERILSFMEEVKDCPFDVMDMVSMPVLHGHKRDNAYNCMSFVAEVLSILDYPLPHELYKNNIEDIENALIARGLEGKIVHLEKQTDEEYMKNISIRKRFISMITLFRKLYGKQEKRREKA